MSIPFANLFMISCTFNAKSAENKTTKYGFLHAMNTRDKKERHPIGCRSFLVETTGIEPVTSCMSSMHSNQLSYASATDSIISYSF